MRIKNFTKHTYKSLDFPNFLEIQRDSYKWFWEKGLRELLDEISPIRDYGERDFELSFLDYKLDDAKYTEFTARERNASYESPLRVRTALKNTRTGEIKEQEIYLGDFPLMTKRGTFVVNGVERIVISQLIRSPGIFFTSESRIGKQLFGGKIIPNRGAWLEFETESSGFVAVRIDRKRKAPATTLLRAFGVEKEEDIKKLVQKFNIEDYLNGVYGLADRSANSKLQRGRELIENEDFQAEKTLMIGDTLHDLEVGQDLGFDVLLVSEGFQCEDMLKESHHQVLFR